MAKRAIWPRRRGTAGAALISVALLAALPARAQTPPGASSPPASPPLKWSPFIDLDVKAGTERNIGEGDLFIPLLQNSDSMLFADIRGRFDDRSDDEGNFGLGLRHMLPSGWNLGAYGYYDRSKTEFGSTFKQATFGTEALSLDWDLRANLYQPVGPTVRNLSTSTSTTTSSTSSSSAALTDTAIQVTTNIATTTTGTTVTTQDVEQRGFDAEIGWRVPVFAPDALTQLRVYVGGYRFDGNGAPAIEGPRGRLDLTIDQVPHLWTGARLELDTEVQHDTPRGTQAFALLSLRIPLQIFPTAAPATLTPMERRMEDRIVRDVDIVDQPHAATTTRSTLTNSTLVENATQTSSGSSFTFINSSSTSGANLPSAVAASNTVVVLNGTFNTTAATTLNAGQTLTAGTLTVRTATGHSAGITTSATISGTVTGAAVVTTNNSTVSNLTLTNTTSGGAAAVGVDVTNVTGVTLTNNTISATTTGSNNAIAVRVQSTASRSASATVSNNSISATATGAGSANAVVVSSSAPGTATTTATVSGNTLNASASGGGVSNAVALVAGAGTTVTVNPTASTGNVKQAGTCSVTNSGTLSGQIGFTDGTHCP